ncbi:MAG: hypothetical protein HYX78_11815 [Armatimonadetes bacterium]|nr:hypothetical protein [Armatimonadota bacterium]
MRLGERQHYWLRVASFEVAWLDCSSKYTIWLQREQREEKLMRAIVWVFCFVILAVGTCKATAAQWSIAAGGNGHWYEAIPIPEGITWPDSKAVAEQSGGYLATITSEAENDFVFSLVKDRPEFWQQYGPWVNGPWLGGYQDLNDPSYSEPLGGWKWVSGESWSYTNWMAGEPSGIGQQYLAFCGYGLIASTWDDNGTPDSLSDRGCIIEWDPEPPMVVITDPTSTATLATALPTIDLKGTVTQVTAGTALSWTNNRGGSGTCVGLAPWTALGIQLYVGENVITVTATDPAGPLVTDSVTVFYDPDIEMIYSNDFESTVGGEWSKVLTDVTPVGGRRFLGQFQYGTVSLDLANLPYHDSVALAIDLFLISTWDGSGARNSGGFIVGPDVWKLSTGDGATLLETTFSNWHELLLQAQAFPDSYHAGHHRGRTGAAENNTLGYQYSGHPIDSIYHLSFVVPHSADNVRFNFTCLNVPQVGDEQSWGIDNVKVMLLPPPPTPATIGQAKALPAGSRASVGDVVVTANGLDPGTVFVESTDRSSGIKLLTTQTVEVGDRVILIGVVERVNGEYQLTDVAFTEKIGGEPLLPVGVTTRAIGNDPTEFLSYMGINTTGLLVRLAGKVTGKSTLEGLIYVDDGFGYQDGVFPTRGIRVHLPSGITLPSTGTRVVVTGICRVQAFTLPDYREVNGDWYPPGTVVYVPSVWVRDSRDIRVL